MTKTKAEIACESKFAFTIKEIKRSNTQVADAIQNKNLKLGELLKSELIIQNLTFKKSYFGIAEENINDLCYSFTEAKDIAVKDSIFCKLRFKNTRK